MQVFSAEDTVSVSAEVNVQKLSMVNCLSIGTRAEMRKSRDVLDELQRD